MRIAPTLSAGLIALLFLACEKDRTCSCTKTRTGTTTTTGKVEQVFLGFPLVLADTSFSQPVNEIHIYDVKYDNVTKRSAQGHCISYSEPYKEVTLTSIPASSFNMVMTVTNEGEDKYSCKLK